MKKSSIFILVLSILVVMFLSAFVGLSISREYAENHYQVNNEVSTTINLINFLDFGCGENDCKYCNGRKVSGGYTYQHEYAEKFVYYRTVSTFRIVSLVCMIVSAVGLTSTLLIKYREPIKRVFKKN